MCYTQHMSDNKTAEKLKVKKLPCGGYAIFGIDIKTKQPAQIGYIGANLPLEAYMPENAVLEK